MHVYSLLPCRQRHHGASKQRNAAKYFAKTFPSKTIRRNALQRLFQAKQRDEMLCKDFSKQNNATKCFAKTFPSKTTRRNALQKLFQAKQRDEMLGNGLSRFFVKSIPVLRARSWKT